jgi:hypothetical protein
MANEEKLRALLAEARVLCDYNVDAQGRRELRVRIDAALAEPVEETDGSACPQCGCDNCEAGRAEYAEENP